MFLSLALDDRSHGTAFSYLQRPDVFNVSITRARNRQVILHSFDPRKLGADGLARKYLEQRSGNKPALDVANRGWNAANGWKDGDQPQLASISLAEGASA